MRTLAERRSEREVVRRLVAQAQPGYRRRKTLVRWVGQALGVLIVAWMALAYCSEHIGNNLPLWP